MEQYCQLFQKDNGPFLQPGESFSHEFLFSPEKEKEYRLFFTGETDLFYYWKTEYMATALYRRITDALVRGKISAFGLQFTGCDYQRLAAHKVTFPVVLGYLGYQNPTEAWQFGITASAKNIKIHEGGYLRIVLEIRDVHDGTLRSQATHAPDRTVTIAMPEGSYELRRFEREVTLPNDTTANVTYLIEGENFEGEIVWEEPELSSADGYNIIPKFSFDSPMYQKYFDWFGVNLSRAEWPTMKIECNGKTVFDGEFFERSHRYSEKEIPLPENALLPGKNTVSFTLTSHWHDALPYRLHELGIVSEAAGEFSIVSCPEVAQVGKPISLLLDLKKDCDLHITTGLTGTESIHLEKGLRVLSLPAEKPANHVDVVIAASTHTEKCTIARIVQREEDNVITGTGDMVYVNQNLTDTVNFLKWYTQNHIGDLLTVRPVYRWSGTRTISYETWDTVNRLTGELGMKLAHMVDGREPQGMVCNPPLSVMEGEQFLGRQEHERDGAYCYWGSHEHPGDFWNINDYSDTEHIFDNMIRQDRQHPDKAYCQWREEDIYNDGKRYWLSSDQTLPMDMEIIAKAHIASLCRRRRDCTRHTGPSILFKYLIQAGFSWVGAETMDSPTEFLMSALRGAKRAYGLKSTGVHHALQWSTHPHDNEMRYRRYRLALYVTWLHGADEINTEEGLWHMEEYYASHHRFSAACREHLNMQQDFNRFLKLHSRRGELHAPVGVLFGRYDGFPCFGGEYVWGQLKTRMNPLFDAEQSWHIPAQSFYPNMVNGFHAMAHNVKTGPIGLVSGTPRGVFDIVPVEEKIGSYQVLAFFSYNKAEKPDMQNVYEAAQNGATVLMTLAHLSDTTLRSDLEQYRLHFAETVISELCLDGVPVLVEDRVNGKPARTAKNMRDGRVLDRTDSGRPLVVEYPAGRGKLILFGTDLYPANEAIREKYTAVFHSLCDEVNDKEHVFPLVDHKVQSVVYDTEAGQKDVYFLAVDWWNEPAAKRPCALRVGSRIYDMSLPFGICRKVVVNGDRLAWCDDEETDILRLDRTITVQGCGSSHIHIAENGRTAHLDLDFTASPLREIPWAL